MRTLALSKNLKMTAVALVFFLLLLLLGCGKGGRENKVQASSPTGEVLNQTSQTAQQQETAQEPLFNADGITRMTQYLGTEDGFRKATLLVEILMVVFHPAYDFEHSQPTPSTQGGVQNIVGKILHHISLYRRHGDADNGIMEIVKDSQTREGKLYQITELFRRTLDVFEMYEENRVDRDKKISEVLSLAVDQADEENFKKAISAYYENFVQHFNRTYHKDAQWEINDTGVPTFLGGFGAGFLRLLLAKGDEEGNVTPRDIIEEFLFKLIAQYYPRQ